MNLCSNCEKVEIDKEDNVITYKKNDEVVRGKVCPICYYNLEEVK